MPTLSIDMRVNERPYWKHYQLETVGGKPTCPEILSLFQVEEIYSKADNRNRETGRSSISSRDMDSRPRLLETNTLTYEFDCMTGAVNQVSKYHGDFRESGFHWSEQKMAEWSGAPVDSDEWDNAYILLEVIKSGLTGKVKETDIKVKDKDELRYWTRLLGNLLKKKEEKWQD